MEDCKYLKCEWNESTGDVNSNEWGHSTYFIEVGQDD